MGEITRTIIARYPGQGSQESGMGAVVAGDCQDALDVFGEGTDILRRDGRMFGGQAIDLRYVCFEATDEELGQNHLTQLSIFATTIAAQRRLKAERPLIVADKHAGHSVGEYAALVAAGVLSFEEGLLLVDARARYMSEAGRIAEVDGMPGGIGVVLGQDVAKVEEIAARNGAYIANYNSPNQTGLSGAKPDLERVRAEVEAERMRYIPLDVSVAVHSPYMEHAALMLIHYIGSGKQFKDPEPYSLVLNRTGEFAGSGERIALQAPGQVTNKVLWYPGMKLAIEESGVDLANPEEQASQVILLEVGHKTVLSGVDAHFAKANKNNVKLVSFEKTLETGLDPEALAA